MANPTQWGSWQRWTKAGGNFKRGSANNSVKVDVYVDSEWANSAREEVDTWRHHDDQWHGGETVG